MKALSDEQIADLEAAAEWAWRWRRNSTSIRGPSHVLELAEALDLTKEQVSRAKELDDRMRAETVPIGKRIVEGLRHTVATILAEIGVDERTVADMLGQKTIEMARHYSKPANKTKK